MKRALAILLAALMLIGIAGCTDNPPTPAGTDKPAETQGKPKALTIPVDWPAYIDPGVGSKAADCISFVNLYDTLVFPNSDATISPMVAESWEANDDCTEYTFHLRDDVVFHSGNKLTAKDVAFSMNRMLSVGEGFAYMYAGLVQSVEAVDEKTVKFTLSSSSGLFPNLLIRLYILDEATVMANIAKDGAYGEFGDYGKNWLLTHDAGSGPYKVKEMITEEHLTMEKYSDYWMGWSDKPQAPDTVKLLGGVDTASMKTMMANGELDASDDAQTAETYAALDALEGVEISRAPIGVNFNIMLNTKLAPTDDVHVRKAIAFATDYDTIANDIYIGSAKATGPIQKGMAGSLSDEECPYKYDLAKAEEELKQSPYYNDLISGAMKLSLTYCSEGGAQQENLALLIQAGMASLGVSVEITGKPFATMMTDAQTVETTPNASFVAFAPSYLDGSGYLKNRYHSSSCGTWEQMEWLQDAEIDALIEQAMSTMDQDARNAIYKEISLKLMDICPTVWMADLASSSAYRADHFISPVAEMFAAGEAFIFAMGYSCYYRDYKILG
ncbi:MAG: putative D,D-dipeptide-binding periplasmic protein DdpA precursor [Firmicutes bacterium ADurb.Bin248]|nr:MAG: putative D,D-dipeptide-binding periplasmic protein DdpA precursor [Firmicutes bacterium ADurb.Bin248]HOG01070.1 ABC transporter substrate-binding protein [Clostridia bacterium]HPK14944.1 ABC transporter substrate-binding protein [Clostridia bacterium]